MAQGLLLPLPTGWTLNGIHTNRGLFTALTLDSTETIHLYHSQLHKFDADKIALINQMSGLWNFLFILIIIERLK